MSTHEEAHLWRQVREDLLRLSEELQGVIGPAGQVWVKDWVDHREFELAFECFLYELTDDPRRRVPLTPNQEESLLTLGKALGYSGEFDIVYKIFLEKYVPHELRRTEKE